MKQLPSLALFLSVVSLTACVNLAKPKDVQTCANQQPTPNCMDSDGGGVKDTMGARADSVPSPTDTTIDAGVPDSMDTKVPPPPDVPDDATVAPKPDTGMETSVPDPKPEATVEPPNVVVEPSTPDGSVPKDTKPPVDTVLADTLIPVDTTLPPSDTKTTGSENCPITSVQSGGNAYGPNVLGGYCIVTCDSPTGWGCSNFGGRTIKVNGKAMACGDPLPAKVNGYYVFEVSPGTLNYSSIYWWGTANATCPLPDGGLLP